MNYAPTEKLNINSNIYFYGEQEFVGQDGNATIDPKAIVNLKASYKIYENHSIFINARNLFSNSNEFAFTDAIGSVYLVGLSLSF